MNSFAITSSGNALTVHQDGTCAKCRGGEVREVLVFDRSERCRCVSTAAGAPARSCKCLMIEMSCREVTGERRRARELLHHCRPLLDIEPRHLHRVATSRRHVFDCRSALSVEPPRAASHMVSNRHVFNCRSAASYRAETCFLLQDRMQPDTLNGKFETKEPVQSENKLTRGVPTSTSLSTRRQPTRCAASASGPTAPRAAPTYATAACATAAYATAACAKAACATPACAMPATPPSSRRMSHPHA